MCVSKQVLIKLDTHDPFDQWNSKLSFSLGVDFMRDKGYRSILQKKEKLCVCHMAEINQRTIV